MKILAFDTSMQACTVALLNGDQINTIDKIAPMQQARLILAFIQELLTAANLSLEELDAIAYGRGPGSFTGIRIASSVAQGLAFATNKPVVPISSLAILAQSAFNQHKTSSMLVAVDAHMGEIYWARYQANLLGEVKLIGKEEVCPPEMVTIPTGRSWYAVGDGWKIYGERLANQLGFAPGLIAVDQSPCAEALLSLAKRGGHCIASQAVPVYLR